MSLCLLLHTSGGGLVRRDQSCIAGGEDGAGTATGTPDRLTGHHPAKPPLSRLHDAEYDQHPHRPLLWPEQSIHFRTNFHGGSAKAENAASERKDADTTILWA